MTFLPLSIALALASPTQEGCALPLGSRSTQRVFTNADLERMAACRYQTGVQSEVGSDPPPRNPRLEGSKTRPAAAQDPQRGSLEADWRAQWRSIDQKTRRLRREAEELRQEAAQPPPRASKNAASGRRSSSLLINRALRLEAEAKEIEDEFQERARREGALPGWLRPKAR